MRGELDWFGIKLDPAKNAAAKGEAMIHATGSRVQLWIMPTNEEITTLPADELHADEENEQNAP